MNVLITGITGMVGSHLAELILSEHRDVSVHGLIRWRSPLENLDGIREQVTLHEGDLRDLNSLVGVLKRSRPDRIFHLAAQSSVPASFIAPAETLSTNVVGTVNLLDAIRIVGLKPRIHVCSSSEVYGQVGEHEIPIPETQPLRPASPYAVSKVGEDLIAQQYALSYGMHIVRSRAFTHTGPRRGEVFAESTFALQIAEIEAGIRQNPVQVGNLESVRTYLDVRDAVRAYWMLLESCPSGEVYNIGGEQTVTIGSVLGRLKRLSRATIQHAVDPARLRPSDVTRQIPNQERFCTATGWVPRIPLEQTLTDLLNYHRRRVAMRAKS